MRRLDAELVEQGFFATADEAMRAVMAGEVSTSDRRLESPGEQVRPGVFLHVRGRGGYVGRGGRKLDGGLTRLGVDPTGLRCLDLGCSTGGFTDCLLKHGARSVCAVDVGYGQFDFGLRGDARVTLLERTNAATLHTTHPELARSFDLAVCDVSFTSVTLMLDAVVALLADGGRFLTLVKPQFEAARDEVGTGGVVRDPAVRQRALERVRRACDDAGLMPGPWCESPIAGRKGNVEYLLLCELGEGRPGGEAGPAVG